MNQKSEYPALERIQEVNAVNKTEGIEQLLLFESEEPWEKEWQGMPEFVQKDLQPYRTLLVHFANRDDFDKFCGLVNQKLTNITKSIWYPEAEIASYMNKRYVDENN